MTRTPIDWFKAAEGWSLPASAMSVIPIVGYVAGRNDVACDWVNATLSLAMMMLFQAGSSTLSDCSDHLRGVDRPDDPKVTWIYSGLFPLGTLYRYAAILLSLGSLCGIAILLRGAWDAAILGFAGILIGVCYSPLKYHAFGDVAIFLAFSLLPSLGVGRVIGGTWLPETMLVGLPVGLVTLSIVHANNWRDMASDREAGILTLPLVVGARWAWAVYFVETFLPYVLVCGFALCGVIPPTATAALLALPAAIKALRTPLPVRDRASALHQLLFGSAYAISLAI